MTLAYPEKLAVRGLKRKELNDSPAIRARDPGERVANAVA